MTLPRRFRPSFRRPAALAPLAAAVLFVLGGCGGSGGGSPGVSLITSPVAPSTVNQLPAGVSADSQRLTRYDGTSDDLLTGGLGASGLGAANAPGYADPARPTAAELRRAAIYNNYHALVGVSAGGGYGTFYGPGLAADGTPAAGDGKVPGFEVLAFSDDGSGRQNVTLMVQVPDTFDALSPCIVVVPAAGLRSVYGSVPIAEWAFRRRCAVATTDKGAGTAPHDLQSGTVPLIDGTRDSAAAAGAAAQFSAGSADELAAFNAVAPNRLAFKHAHSRRNPEQDWGRFTLKAVEFAFFVLNERYGLPLPGGTRARTLWADNTLVIAAGSAAGGAAAIAAAEQDGATDSLIDGVAVAEPQLQLPDDSGVVVRRGGVAVASAARPLIDVVTWADLYQACAAQSATLAGAPDLAGLPAAFATARCTSLDGKGLLAGEAPAPAADQALARMRRHGWEPESDPLYASLAGRELTTSTAVAYANAYARADVRDRLCGYSYSFTNGFGVDATLAAQTLPTLFATGNGQPPQQALSVQLFNDASPDGAVRSLLSRSASTGVRDLNLDGTLCLRNLVTGSDAAAQALQAGSAAVRRSGQLGGRPTLIVHGRADALVPVNHSSRPYAAFNRAVEGASSRLRYVEVTNAQHFDAFIDTVAGYDTRYVPLHVYLTRALDAVYATLKNGAPLPPSQVVRTLPRGGTPGAAPALTAANLPAIAATPAAADAVTVGARTIDVPN